MRGLCRAYEDCHERRECRAEQASGEREVQRVRVVAVSECVGARSCAK